MFQPCLLPAFPCTQTYHSTLVYIHSLKRDQRFKVEGGAWFWFSPSQLLGRNLLSAYNGLGWVFSLQERGALGGALSSLGCSSRQRGSEASSSSPQLPHPTLCFCPRLYPCRRVSRSLKEMDTSAHQLPGVSPNCQPVPSHHFPKQKLSRSSAARSERAKHAFVRTLVILSSWVGATHNPRPWMAILTLKRKSYFWLAVTAVWWNSFPATQNFSVNRESLRNRDQRRYTKTEI